MTNSELTALAVGGPTIVLGIGGLRILVDPTFSPPGEYETAPGRFLAKLTGPAVPLEELGRIDAVLLSHDQHVDNLDPAGRALLPQAPVVLTTPAAAARLGSNAIGLEPWAQTELHGTDGAVCVTAVPALHGPEGSEPVVGEVTGFVLTKADAPSVYLSGDNASLDRVAQIARRFPTIDVAVLFAGAATSPRLLGDAHLTLDSGSAARAAEILGAGVVVPVHYEGWGHFTEGEADLQNAFDEANLGDSLQVLVPGRETTLDPAVRSIG
jgi:L-ascorbate metabolism protein UlaG (beta-lactamase superfamily)